MALLATGEIEPEREPLAGARAGTPPRRLASAVLVTSGVLSATWLIWRVLHLGSHPIELAVFVTELASVTIGLVVGLAMVRATGPQTVDEDGRRESFRFVFVVADIVGRPRTRELRPDLAASYRVLRRSRPTLPDFAMAAVLLDGPRYLVVVLSLTVALLLGVAPMPVPPMWAIAAGVGALVSMSLSHVLASDRRIGFGDRIRWSSSAFGELLPGVDRDDVAPRRWVGTVAAVVVLNLAIALRGMSDRWTHGLSPMPTDERHVAMLMAIVVVVGGLYTLRTTAVPVLANSHLVPRRAEERTARKSAIGGAVAIGMVGLTAGILPGNFDTVADHTVPVEQISEPDVANVAHDEDARGD